MRAFVIKSAVFVLLPLLAGQALWHYRATKVPPAWYLGAAQTIERQHVDAIFIGSSRVGAAIDDTVFSTTLTTCLRRTVKGMNMGKGYSTMAEHFFGLRLMITSSPEHFRNCTVFVEAPDGIPDASTWTDSWVHSEWPSLLGPYLKADDVRRLWSESGTTLADKINVTAGAATITVFAATKARGELNAEGENFAGKFLNGESRGSHMDLAETAGIRVDSAGVALTRLLAIQYYTRETANQLPVSSWDVTIAHAIVAMVTSSGGHVVFYTMPVSSVQEKSLRTPVRNADRVRFQEDLARWGVQYIAPGFSTDDGDFPDLWHLRQSRSAEFTRFLAAAYAIRTGLLQPITGTTP